MRSDGPRGEDMEKIIDVPAKPPRRNRRVRGLRRSLLLTLLPAAPFIATASWGEGDQAKLAAQLQAMTQEMVDAVAPGNTKVWDKYLDPALVFVTEENEVLDKPKLLAGLTPLPAGDSGNIRVTEFQLRDHAQFAVSTYVLAESESIEGHTIHNRYRETDTWHRTTDGWRLVAAQVTALNKDPPSIVLSNAVLDQYAGTYALSAQTKETITRDGTHLVVVRAGRPTQSLTAEAQDVFFAPGKPRLRWIFQHGAGGTIVGFASRREGEDIVWKRQQMRAGRVSTR